MRLYDLAKVVRSKNAGPFTLTLDLMFEDEAKFDQALNSPEFTAAKIAELYHADPAALRLLPFRRALAIKITIPRPVSSGAPGDLDVYGSQQHFPLGGLRL